MKNLEPFLLRKTINKMASNSLRDHPFKTSAFFRGEGVKNLPNLPTDSSKKADGRGVGVKNHEKFADVLNGWSLSWMPSIYILEYFHLSGCD